MISRYSLVSFRLALVLLVGLVEASAQKAPSAKPFERFTLTKFACASINAASYRAIARELAEPNASVNGIARRYRVSNHTVMGIREREAKSIAERKNTLAVKLANVAEIGAERMEEMIGKASLHDTTIATGVATDKVIALTSQTPSINIVNIPMPTAEERAEMNAIDRTLAAIAAKLKA